MTICSQLIFSCLLDNIFINSNILNDGIVQLMSWTTYLPEQKISSTKPQSADVGFQEKWSFWSNLFLFSFFPAPCQRTNYCWWGNNLKSLGDQSGCRCGDRTRSLSFEKLASQVWTAHVWRRARRTASIALQPPEASKDRQRRQRQRTRWCGGRRRASHK